MTEPIIYDLCVVGAGMFGSAAARHASANPNIKVCLVGPAEPTSDEFPNRELYGATYDEGRVTRILDDTAPCQVLSHNSIYRFRELEKFSEIKFYAPVGCLFTGRRTGTFMQACLRSAGATGVRPLEMAGNDEEFQRKYPHFRLHDDEIALLDECGGGYICPRSLVAAQQKVASEQGCRIIESFVCTQEKGSDGIHVVKTDSAGEIKAKRLLIATGGFVCLNRMDIVKPMKPMLVKRMKETVVLLRLPDDEVRRLSAMPSMISVRDNKGVYILPPIKYPDGQYYLKFGKLRLQEDENDELKTLDELRRWYWSDGDPDIEPYLQLVKDLIPGLRYDEVSKRTCATCNTPSGMPYIERVSPTVTVAVAGNGKGAKFSDEVGRIAAHLSLTGRWGSKITQNHFEAAFR